MSTHVLPVMAELDSGKRVRTVARSIVIFFLASTVALIFTPWQQSVSGMGHVSALTPVERVQAISAPMEGRVARWHVAEGVHVNEGQLILELTDNDPMILERLSSERQAVGERLMMAERRAASHDERLGRLQESKTNAVNGARNRVQMANERIVQNEQAMRAAEERLTAARLNIARQKSLLERGLTSQRTVELAQQEFATAEAEVRRAVASLSAARTERQALEDDFRKVTADADAAIEGERAALNLARAEIANIKAELQRMDSRLARQQTLKVYAPRDGTVLRLLAQPNSELLKSGEPVVLFVPDAREPTVELWLDGMDMPLVHVGDKARLQFNGWPAIQFVGWPAVAVGTFGGVVRLVDSAETNGGKFRILVTPDPEDAPWPSARYLRQGVQAKGWILLRQVTLGWELWRRFNGFPPVIAQNEPGAAGTKGKKK